MSGYKDIIDAAKPSGEIMNGVGILMSTRKSWELWCVMVRSYLHTWPLKIPYVRSKTWMRIDNHMMLTCLCWSTKWRLTKAISALKFLGIAHADATAFVKYEFARQIAGPGGKPENLLTDAQKARLSETRNTCPEYRKYWRG
jgi:hypothetical protein